MRLTATNTYLFRCKLTNSNLCDLCNEYDEDIEHLFWKCREAQHLWNRLADYMYDKGILLYFNYELICFGQMEYNKNMQTINFIIYLMKYYIFKLKTMHQPPDFLTFLK